jgi:hypothetical protein
MLQPAHRKKNKEMHLVYAGTIWDKWRGHASFPEMIERIIQQDIHLHIYPSNKLSIELKNKLKKMSENNTHLHIHDRVDESKINKEISKFDFALHLDFFDDIVDKRWIETGMSAKIFGYLEAGLPILINKQFTNMSRIIEDNKLGKSITYDSLLNLRRVLKESPSLEEIKRGRDNFLISNHINKLEKFYERVHNLNIKK